MSSPNRPRPRIGPDNEPFWEGCRGHSLVRFQLARNVASRICRPGLCALTAFLIASPGSGPPAKAVSPVGPSSTRRGFRRLQGRHSIQCLVQIELDEGPRLSLEPRRLSGRKPEIGQRVEVVFDDVDDTLTLHRFRALA